MKKRILSVTITFFMALSLRAETITPSVQQFQYGNEEWLIVALVVDREKVTEQLSPILIGEKELLKKHGVNISKGTHFYVQIGDVNLRVKNNDTVYCLLPSWGSPELIPLSENWVHGTKVEEIKKLLKQTKQ